jgi:phenylacetate-CoA ligase
VTANEPTNVEDLRALQLARMRDVVRRAYENVPHYRTAFDAAHVTPDDLHTLADIAEFPLTTKAHLRNHYPYGMFAVPMEKIVRIHASSGTTGKPTVVGYTAKDIETWSMLMARSIKAAGGSATDIIHVAYGYGLFTGGLGAHYGGEYLGASVIPVSGGFTERQVQIITDFKPTIIMVTPSYMLAIADEFDRQGIDPLFTSLKLGIFGAEPWGEGMRGELERRMGLDAVDIYGLSEVMGPGIAQECADSRGALTIWEDHFYPEIINPETGQPVPDGEPGELVLTTLTKEGMPLIRYRTRDLTRLLPPTTRPMRRIARISGRSDDMMIIRGVNVFPSNIEAVLEQEERLAPHYLLELRRPGSLDELDVVVETRPALSGKLSSHELRELETKAEHLIKVFAGVTTKVRVVEPGTLERSQGKAKRVIDLRPKD